MMMGRLWGVAVSSCGGRLVAVTEGGYDLAALAGGLEVSLETFVAPPRGAMLTHGDTTRARSAIEAVRAVQTPFWPTL